MRIHACICMVFMLPSQAHSSKRDTFQVGDIVIWYLQVVPLLPSSQIPYKKEWQANQKTTK